MISIEAGACAVMCAVLGLGCFVAPSPLNPALGGSVGLPHRGMLSGGTELAASGPGYRFLRTNDRHHAIPRFVRSLERAAADVERQRPGSLLVLGDLSRRGGGQLPPHLSHRTGRDADLLLYVTTLEGAPVESPGFVHFGADGLAWDDTSRRWLRFDVERQWLLLRALLTDPEARVQWAFAGRAIESALVEWALARGEPAVLVARAQEVMLEPHPGGPHDDHLHVRTACAPDEVARGCMPSGPQRPWIDSAQEQEHATPEPAVAELVQELCVPLAAAGAVVTTR